MAARAKSPKQRRYSVEWIYECHLMSIESSSLYEHVRKKNILPLPCKDTLMRYIQKLDSAFGFPKAIFDTLKFKGSRMEINQKRGTLIYNSYDSFVNKSIIDILLIKHKNIFNRYVVS